MNTNELITKLHSEAIEKQQKINELQERIDKALKELICLDGSLTNGRISDNICYIIEILKGEE